ncbi:uncharacterized protein LOC115240948 [Formica exsecta]|uniref:uncharacterized protein LOC115240948 n=1 Tax=Formica exsecta TaxID=72781 RepID=UPI001142B6EE|nr:uncharacterized protein LOC115240948 [Formica exsecta]
MDFSTCDATDKVGDGSLLATVNIPNKSTSSEHLDKVSSGIFLSNSRKRKSKKEIVCPYDVVNVRRLNRRALTLSDSGSESVSYIPSKTVCITFKGQVLPKYIFFCMVRYDVTPFISKVSICSLCLRYGHTSTQCKGHPRCSHCAERSHEEGFSCPRINSPPSCANCKGPHNSKDLSCPERLIQRQIRELAATKNIPLIEARRLIRSNNSGLGTNPQFDFSNFPVLNEPYSPLSPASSPNIPTSSTTSFPFSFADTVKYPPTSSSSFSPSCTPSPLLLSAPFQKTSPSETPSHLSSPFA